jgi:hypothetical protein
MKITGKDLSALNGAGTASDPDPITGLVTLTATDDFYFVIPFAEDGDVTSIHILTGAAITGTFTVETCNFRKKRNEVGPDDVTDYNEVSGNWVKENPSTAYVATVGTGWSGGVGDLTLVKTAGAGGAMIHLGNLGARRVRLKLACTTSGTVRVVAHGKA